MTDWNKNISTDQIKVGDKLPDISIPITLQRLVMEAGANYDLSLFHHDKEVAITVGAPDAFANSFFNMGMYERLLREWAGPNARLKKIGSLKMIKFNGVGDTVTFEGVVSKIEENIVTVDLISRTSPTNITTTAFGIVQLNKVKEVDKC